MKYTHSDDKSILKSDEKITLKLFRLIKSYMQKAIFCDETSSQFSKLRITSPSLSSGRFFMPSVKRASIALESFRFYSAVYHGSQAVPEESDQEVLCT